MIFFELFLILCLVSAAYAGIRAAPWWPTNRSDLERVLTLAEVQPGQVVYDLGCGDGRLLATLARHTQAKKIIGYEISIFFYLLSLIRTFFHAQVDIRLSDFWKADLHEADLVYLFLMRRIYPRLKEKLEKELKPGTKIICYVWPIEGWTPVKIDIVTGRSLYLYQR